MLKETVWELAAQVGTRTGVSSLFPNGNDAILCYHAVGDPAEWGNVSTGRFRRDLEYLTDRYEVVDLPAILEGGNRKRVAITFDDGHENFYTRAMPVIRSFNLPVTVFVVTDAIGKNDTNLNSERTMDEAQIRDLVEDDLVTIGNHTMTHPRLSEVSDLARRRTEIVGARDRLEDRFGITVDRFCYPSGDHDPAAVDLVRESHACAVTTYPSLVGSESDPYLLPRVQAHHSHRRLRWDLTNLGNDLRDIARNWGLVTR